MTSNTNQPEASFEQRLERWLEGYWGVSGHNRAEKRPMYVAAILAAHNQAVAQARREFAERLTATVRGEGEPGNAAEMVAVNYVDDIIERTLAALEGEQVKGRAE